MTVQGPQGADPKHTVLIADSDGARAKTIAATLHLSGLQTVVACDGEQALALARALQPDLIVLGVMMPGKSGDEVCVTLKTDPVTASIPVMCVTGQADATNCATGTTAEADEYLTRPFSPDELAASVEKLLAGQPHLRRLDPSTMPADQLVVYARELRGLFEREQNGRQALEEAHRRLDELDRLKAAFLGAVTHGLLTPFPAIGKALQVLQRQAGRLQPDQRSALDNLMTEIACLHRLVTGVVKFAELVNRRRAPQPGIVALDRVIPWAVQPAAVLAQAREEDFRVFVPPDLPKVYADAGLLGEAIFQMAHNAVKFNLPGGRAEVRAFESDGWVVVEVSDTGVGLTPERLAQLEQPFGQGVDAVRREGEGLGVGWAFVCYVAEAHGGRTRVASPGPGQGSTFSLSVPVAAQAQELDAACGTDTGR
jgi:signal transduction histidine kinase